MNMEQNNILFTIKAIGAAVGAAFAFLLGGADVLLWVLLTCMVADYVTGIVKGLMTQSLSSEIMWRGGLKKILMLVVVALSVAVDKVVVLDQGVIRAMVMGYYIAMEGLSMLENIGECGVPYPPQMERVLRQLKQKNEGKDDENK